MINLNPRHFSCGCEISKGFCDCREKGKLKPFTVTKAQLQRLPKRDLHTIYTRCVSDEMSPIFWNGMTKTDGINAILTSQQLGPQWAKKDVPDSVTLTPFI